MQSINSIKRISHHQKQTIHHLTSP